MDLLYSLILVSSLIFVHELGHFLFAKAFGVKVITFSLGFGPKVLKLRGRETEYCISLLPLGGYVKMLEASKTDVVLPEDRKRTFESLPVFKRVVIVLAGPVMNLIFPVLLYFGVFFGNGPLLPPTVGVVLPGHPADGKLRPGDRIMSIDGQEVATFDEVKRIIGKSPAKTVKLTVFRDNRQVEVEVTTEESVSDEVDAKQRNLDLMPRVGTMGIQPNSPAAVIGVPNPDSPAFRAGLRTFDVITNVGGMPVRRFMDLSGALSENAGETLPVTYLRPVSVPDALGGLADMAVFESGVVALTPDPSGSSLFERTGIELADLYVASLPQDSYLAKAGLKPGDKILRLDEVAVSAWSTFSERVLSAPDKEHRVDYQSARDGRVRRGKFQIRREDYVDRYGQAHSRYVPPSRYQWLPLALDERVEHPTPIRYALQKAVEETVEVTRFTLVCIVRLLQGRLSWDALSGPITIFEIAGEEGRKGPDNFVWVMALLSINLGLLNLLPIPVLDGGHLMFFAIEGILRKPLPLRTREVAHIIGMAILFTLMAIAFRNDVQKRGIGRGQIGVSSG